MRNRNRLPLPETRAAPPRAGTLRRAALLLVALGFGGLMVLSGRVDCVFAKLLGIPCPGCGSTRAILTLARGDVLQALALNPVAPFVVLLLVAIALRALVLMVTRGSLRALGEGPVGTWSLRLMAGALVVQLLVWALRFLGLFGGPVGV